MSHDKYKKRVQSTSKSGSRLPHKRQRDITGLDPSQMGFTMPDWMEQPSASAETPADDPYGFSEDDAASTYSPQSRSMLEGMKVVCICKGITKRVFWKALDEGLHTKEDINRCTGSGSGGCQGRRCGPRIAEMLRSFSK